MALGHKDSRRPGRRAFQPTIDGRLETRVLMAQLTVRTQVAAGGAAVVVTNTNGAQFFVSVTQGTIRGTPAPGGRVNLVASGTNSNTLLEINQIIPMHSGHNTAHTFDPTLANATGTLNIASLNVTSGRISAIEGYHTAILSGPLTVSGTSTVGRIAFSAIRAGGSINVGGTLSTLDIYNDAVFDRSAGLAVGLDLDWFEVGGNLSFDDGANMVVGRDLGALPQVAKGSGNPGQGLYVNGNFTIGTAGKVAIVRNIGTNLNPIGILVNGNFSGASRFSVGGLVYGPLSVRGTVTA